VDKTALTVSETSQLNERFSLLLQRLSEDEVNYQSAIGQIDTM